MFGITTKKSPRNKKFNFVYANLLIKEYKIKDINREKNATNFQKADNFFFHTISVNIILIFCLFFICSILAVTLYMSLQQYKRRINIKQKYYEDVILQLKEQIILNQNQADENKRNTGSKDDFEINKIFGETAFQQMLGKFLEIEKNKEFLDPDFKLSYLAKKLDTNTTYLSSFFNNFLKKGFNQYLQEKRIEYLLELLKKDSKYTKYTVQAISEHIGYKSSSAFSKVFKQHMGISYSEFIKG